MDGSVQYGVAGHDTCGEGGGVVSNSVKYGVVGDTCGGEGGGG